MYDRRKVVISFEPLVAGDLYVILMTFSFDIIQV